MVAPSPESGNSPQNPHVVSAAVIEHLERLDRLAVLSEARLRGLTVDTEVAIYAGSVWAYANDAAQAMRRLFAAPVGEPFLINRLVPHLTARWAIESHIRLRWLLADPEVRIRLLKSDNLRAARATSIALGQHEVAAHVARLHAEIGAVPRIPVEEMAQEAGLRQAYAHYRVLCESTHGAPFWIASDVARGADGAWAMAVEAFVGYYAHTIETAAHLTGAPFSPEAFRVALGTPSSA